MPDFRSAEAEFDRQAIILESLVSTVEVSARQDGIERHRIDGAELPLVPTGGRNTMAAAAIVLLAAHFEQYIRQQVEEYVKAIILNYAYLESGFRERLVDEYWRAGSVKLNRIRPKNDPLWASTAGPLLQGLIDYPVGGDIGAFVAATVSEHEHNMRWDTIVELTARVGVRDLAGALFRSAPLKASLANPRKDTFSALLKQRLDEFYILRNTIVHSIAQTAGIGETIFKGWAEFLRLLTAALAGAVEMRFNEFTSDAARRRAAAGA